MSNDVTREAIYKTKRTKIKTIEMIELFRSELKEANCGTPTQCCLSFVLSHNLCPLVGVRSLDQLAEISQISRDSEVKIPKELVEAASRASILLSGSMLS